MRPAVIFGMVVLAACGAPESGRESAALPDRIVLTYADDPATTQSVSWRMPNGVAEGVAEITRATGAPNLSATSERYTALAESTALTGSYHSVMFAGLTPDTHYAYRVGAGGAWSPWHQFRTAASEPLPFTFVYFGDAQNGIRTYWARTVRAAMLTEPDARFIVHAGDLVNDANADEQWSDWFGAAPGVWASIPSLPATGNHEYVQPNSDLNRRLSLHWSPQFMLPVESTLADGLAETVYKVDYQQARIIVLNTTAGLAQQTAWLEQQLESAGPRWTIVVLHHPVFTSRRIIDYPEVRNALLPIFDRYAVDLVLQGHDHNYARGHTVLTEDESGTVAARSTFVTSVAGAKMYGLDENRWEEYRSTGVRLVRAAENTQLFQVVRVGEESLRLEAHLPTGELYDAFTLIKQADRTKRVIDDDIVLTTELNCGNTSTYDAAFEATELARGSDSDQPPQYMACQSPASPETKDGIRANP